MSNEEKTKIQDQLDLHHKALMDKMVSIEEQIAPIVRIYKSAEGFGSVISWVAKYIVTPIIILLGAILTIKKLSE